MSRYLRRRIPGSSYFFTARLADRNSDLLVREIDRLRHVTRLTMNRYPMRIEAIAVLPSAIHTIWTLPEGDADFSNRWSMLKALFSRGLPPSPYRSPTQIRRGEKGIWQRRFWEHQIRDAPDLALHVSMIHASPVQAGLCAHPTDWLHSSIHRALRPRQGRTLPGVGLGATRKGAAGLHLT